MYRSKSLPAGNDFWRPQFFWNCVALVIFHDTESKDFGPTVIFYYYGANKRFSESVGFSIWCFRENLDKNLFGDFIFYYVFIFCKIIVIFVINGNFEDNTSFNHLWYLVRHIICLYRMFNKNYCCYLWKFMTFCSRYCPMLKTIQCSGYDCRCRMSPLAMNIIVRCELGIKDIVWKVLVNFSVETPGKNGKASLREKKIQLEMFCIWRRKALVKRFSDGT